jgi:hypothetical protein
MISDPTERNVPSLIIGVHFWHPEVFSKKYLNN